MPAYSEGYAETNGIRLHYYRSNGANVGARPPIVLLHGLTQAARCWMRVARRLEDSYDLIMPDARGHGLSEGPGPEFNLELLAADVAGLIRALHLERPFVLGHSMGAVTTAAVAARYPDCTRGAILSDPPFLVGEPDTKPDEYYRSAEHNYWLPSLLPARALTREARIAERRAQCNWAEEDLELWAEAIEQLRLEVVERNTNAALGLHRWREIVPAIRCPVLLLTSDTERGGIVTPAVAEEVVKLVPTCRVVHIPGAGHQIYRDQYEAFMAAITAFLSQS